MLLARRRVPTASVVQHAHHNTVIGMLLAVLLTLACATPAQAAIDETLSEHEGKSVVIPCPVNKAKCGDLHSINWFKGDDRIAAMLLGDSNVTSVSDEYANRVTVEQNPFRLVINDLKISDEDIYLCDTTFLIPIETCDNFNGYRVELNVLVPPTEVVILDEKGDRIENGSIIGPMQERQTLKVSCVVQNTRPQPQVGWWRGNKRLLTHSASYVETDGLFTATLELNLELSRDDLARDIECRVESAALPNKLINKFRVDLQVRPTSISINGVEHHTVQGSKVVLTCDIHGARPAVNLTWFNSTAVIGPEENDLTEIRTKAFEKDDGTYHTQSELIFNATRFENDMIFRCDADNVVLQINREKPFTSSLTLEVLYPPVVKVSPPEITVNTSDTVLLNCEYVANPASLTQVVWYRNGDLVNVNDTERYEGGNSENVALVIRSTDKEDVGNYTCQLSNAIGKGISEQQIDLDVQFVPIVEVLMIPEGPVKESDESNVTLYCNILEANPALLTKVRWYANSTLLKELPDCEETKEDLCHIDPSKLLLESIGRGFFYNYSCEGYNAAGWGPRSEDKELMVHYEPGPATLTHFPLIAVKKKSVTFSCSVDDPGYPESNRFRWQRGGLGPLQDIVTKDWTVEPVGLDSRTNYSCYAYNEGGKGMMASVNLEVHAPPFFIKNLVPYTGMLHTSRTANLTCRIECVPRCEITWLKGTEPIEKNDTRYFIKEKYMDASPATGDFESMFSVLHFNMSNWPNQKFDIESDSANYTCVSTGNTVGPGIKSATYFSIEYAPENSTVSEEKVYVQEGTIPGRVICNAKANPSAHYSWYFNNTKLGQDQALIINTPMTRNDSGVYTCVASNKHGKSTVETIIDVQFKPRCAIERDEIDDQDTLICTAFGNPVEADFSWSIKAENDSAEWLGSGERRGFADRSYYVLDDDYAIARTYRCVANNTVGPGSFCEFDVAEQLAWWQRWDKTTLIILVASILALLLAVIIICCIIICICRRRRRQDKLQDKSSSLGDPLTEPGEYENLPFHGLQTAPNKFSTTLTNFNNNTNVVRVAPRPKRLNGNIGPQQHHQLQQQHYEQDQYDQQFQYHQHQQHHQQQQQHQYNTMQYVGAGGRVITTNPQHQQAHTMNSHNKGMLQHHQQQQQQQHMLISAADGASGNVGAGNTDPGGSGYMNGSVGGGAAPHQITYNLNNCFPKSYTEYYHQQQQQKHKNGASNNTSSAQLLNAIEHDYPTYAVVERNSGSASASDMGGLDGHSPRAGHPPTAAAVSTNPFLAISNFKKYDTSGGTSDNAYQPHILDISGSSSMQRSGKRKPMLDGKMEDKKFYSLKFTGGGGKHKTPHVVHKSPASGLLNASMILHGSGSNSSSGGKCKRHHSFAGGSIGDIDSAGPGAQHNAHQVKSSALMRFYDPPAYENLAGDNTAAVQVHECAVEAHPSPAAGGMSGTATILLHPQPTASGSGVSGSHTTAGQTGHKKKHHHRQHQQKDDFNLIEPERLSIYRSDSGISNSSYECVTPVPPPPGSTRTTAILNGTPPPKTPKGNKLAKHASTVSGAPNTGSLVNGINYKKSLRQLGGSKCNIANATASGTSLPVYMNVDGQPAGAFERSCSPSSNLVNSSYESASSSQNDGHGGHGSTDPTSLSSCNSLYSSGTGTLIGVAPLLKTGVGLTAPRCGLHQKPAEITTPEEYEQYQLGHHRHSASSLSVASTVSASGTRRCKKQQNVLAPAGSVTGIEHYAIGVTNPFLASERSATATGCAANAAATADGYSAHGRDKKLRRKTISDPYAHIRYIAYSRSAANNSSNNGAADCQAHAHNYRAQYACNAPKAATATTTTAAAAQQIKLQQQHDNNNSRKHQQHQQSLLIPRKLCANNNKQNEHGDKDDEAVDEHKNKDVAMCQQQRHRLVPLGGNADDRDIVVVTKKTATTEDHMCDNNVTAGLDVSAHAVLPHSEDAQNATSTTTPATYGATGDYLARRPVKLPLRKYHTFHFQPSQTVAGTLRHCKLQQLRIQMQHKQQLENFELPAHHGDEAELTAPSQQPIALIAEARPTRRYAIEGGPLVFRPLSWHEQRTFKPIASPVGAGEAPIEHPTTTRDNAKIPLSEPHREEEEEEKSELSEELADEIKQITRSAQLPHVSLNPAASLEALEALTKHHPELIYATKPGTRQNLHKQLALPERWTQQLDVENRLSTSRTTSQDWTATQSESDVKVDEVAANAALEAPCDDEEDLGYSFCEDDDEDEGVEELVGELVESVSTEGAVVQRTTVSSESPRVVLSAGRNGGHVKYMLRQSYREVHI
ncbi:uncharacterized protein LOC105214792 isoform X4 [Zeugodacus cucurbitae]|uniref:uncharacterized protein LOC105214792 isoform X4 n=1 Tax=Zeugodacus cucurbitae TaxID=28588 RepID=UPI0023D95B02|nr:uncharacterized protein LOC105214792 isoform X4 [Zeugodacus cucurbitae]